MSNGHVTSDREAFDKRLSEIGLQGHWTANAEEPKSEPDPRAPFLWNWSDIEPMLIQAANLYDTTGGAARRTLRLCPPELSKSTTPTIHTSIQCVMPGETASIHRHSMGAFRFIISEAGGETIVNGQTFPMQRFDLITTPAWSWHEHKNLSNRPAVWIDGHDLPIVRHVNSVFFESDRRVGAEETLPGRAIGHRFAGIEYLERLSTGEGVPSEYEGRVITYQVDSQSDLFPTIECNLHALNPSTQTHAHRHTWSQIFFVVSGSGFVRTPFGDLAWSEGDLFLVPAWLPHLLIATKETILFCANDRPLLRAIHQDRETPCDL